MAFQTFQETAAQAMGNVLARMFGSRNEKVVRRIEPLVAAIGDLEPETEQLSDAQLIEKSVEFRKRLAGGESLDDILVEAFACCREAAKRTVGMRHFDVQLLGGIILHRGGISEMVTGEGKTLVATCPAYLNALEGQGVHVVTVNDYLAKRDAEWMGPIYRALGLTVGYIQANMESTERQPQYACDITYGTNNEFGFDYLRDNMKVDAALQVQKRRHYAIVDEVDNILIDEARTPLIISGGAEKVADLYYKADRAVARLQGRTLVENDEKARAYSKEHGIEAEQAKEAVEHDVDYVYSEKNHSAYLTERGMDKARKSLGVDDFYSPENMEWPHYLENALKAHCLYKKDVEYVLKDGEVIIVDEFTGRMMEGRRWSDGLHQAVEAKEGLRIKEETQTLATITLQNFFRLYKKLAGMTGTAMTEAREFMKIYKLDCVSVPSNRPMRRINYPDLVFGTEEEKFEAICEEVVRAHEAGRPVLVGTISIEKSERLSLLLTRRGVPHEVLNAKQHEREAHIVALAGQLGAVTIATNMAGRGTDIVLGEFTREQIVGYWKEQGLVPRDLAADTPEEELKKRLLAHWEEHYLKGAAEPPKPREGESRLEARWRELGMAPIDPLARSVAGLGGLHIVGTERHESRRIDNQLRGRSGRQGDPGSSRFFLSLEDDLMRIFASEWVRNFMRRMGLTGGMPLESGLVTRQIEKAQRRVEEHNFSIRQRVMEYDEVMNEQRRIVYGLRQRVLEGEDLKAVCQDMIGQSVKRSFGQFVDERQMHSEWDMKGLSDWAKRKFGLEIPLDDLVSREPEEVRENLLGQIKRAYDEREAKVGPETMRMMERFLVLEVMDRKWKDHLRDMDYLKEGIGFRGYLERDPKIAYKREGLEMFQDMTSTVAEDVSDLVLRMEIAPSAVPTATDLWQEAEAVHVESEQFEKRSAEELYASEHGGSEGAEQTVKQVRRDEPKIGRNDPCTCGSGKKYKKCCGKGK
ncbi:MAG TPA: preprotein translocase subunit SecA [Planctomycetota bacterium]|nr:preprotein translocase subunit SecA [Planctomycetota bacterium]